MSNAGSPNWAGGARREPGPGADLGIGGHTQRESPSRCPIGHATSIATPARAGASWAGTARPDLRGACSTGLHSTTPRSALESTSKPERSRDAIEQAVRARLSAHVFVATTGLLIRGHREHAAVRDAGLRRDGRGPALNTRRCCLSSGSTGYLQPEHTGKLLQRNALRFDRIEICLAGKQVPVRRILASLEAARPQVATVLE